MRWSIRAHLTAWYGLVMVAVLATSVIAVELVQSRFGLQRLDRELHRLMLTLEGVLRTEYNEGLSIQAAADEASTEVVAPDRMLVLVRPDGTLMAMWGRSLEPSWRPNLERPVVETIVLGASRVRVVSRPVINGTHDFIAAVIAPLEELESEQSELLTALSVGVFVALLVAVGGGWVVGRQTLRPLTDMAAQATAITGQSGSERLHAPNAGDELGRFASAFNGLLDRLAAALHSQRQFMADASHELRTPVSVVKSTAQVTLARDHRGEDEYRESFTIVAEQATRLARLVEDMFLLSRAEAQGIPLALEPLYVDELVSECVRALRVIAGARGITLETTGATEITFSGDNTMLRQMVGNLLDNAIRHAKRRVSTKVSVEASAIVIEVVDDGDGIPADRRVDIFRRFVSLDPRSAGAGLGLPIARSIAEAHGGRLTLEEGTDATRFRIVLPIAGAMSSSGH